jgi:glycine C-acetyltransferase
MYGSAKQRIEKTLAEIREAGLWKEERVIGSSQHAHIRLNDGREVINMCANNYLGLANHPDVIAAAHAALDRWGYGCASVRFICGTQEIHRELECKLSGFLGTEDTILYSSCFDANGGLFETLLGEEDAIISDALNHASIIDGVRLCKAQRYRYANCDMAELEARLIEAKGARTRMIATDGVFSMDGSIAPLDKICDLAENHDALVMVDDSHAVGFLGAKGRGTHEFRGCLTRSGGIPAPVGDKNVSDTTGWRNRVDIITGTMGKALGGASGGYTSGRKEIIQLLRQRSRPYLFSNSIPPALAAATIKVLEMLSASTQWRDRLEENTKHFRAHIQSCGFTVLPGEHPIIPVMLGDARLAQQMAAKMLEHGIYVIGFSFPVVPHGKARIRTQVSAAHTREDLDRAIAAFTAVKKELG